MDHYINLEDTQLKRVTDKLDDTEKAQFLFFRLMGPVLQRRIAGLIDMQKVPRVFIHGNPHLDNYAKTPTGAGMIDFDRSRLGPYAWDIIRFYASLALRQENGKKIKLPTKVYEAFKEGYLSRLYNADLFYQTPAIMSRIVAEPEQMTTRGYVKSKGKWSRKMQRNSLPNDDKTVLALLDGYVENSNQAHLYSNYKLAEVGIVPGSLGKLHYILLLVPKKDEDKYDDILLDIKETYTEEDDEWFSNPTDHHGLRMIKASMLYAPGVETGMSYCTIGKKQFWGREIPAFKGKIPKELEAFDLADVAYSVGSQLGRGHRRSCKAFDPKLVETHFTENHAEIEKIAQFLNRELLLGYEFLEKSAKLEQEMVSTDLLAKG